jgi:hypothetical protein
MNTENGKEKMEKRKEKRGRQLGMGNRELGIGKTQSLGLKAEANRSVTNQF